MKNKQLAHIDANEVERKIAADKPLTLAELATHLEVAYSVVKSWDWLPLISRKVFYADFIIARRRFTGLEPDPRVALRRPAPR